MARTRKFDVFSPLKKIFFCSSKPFKVNYSDRCSGLKTPRICFHFTVSSLVNNAVRVDGVHWLRLKMWGLQKWSIIQVERDYTWKKRGKQLIPMNKNQRRTLSKWGAPYSLRLSLAGDTWVVFSGIFRTRLIDHRLYLRNKLGGYSSTLSAITHCLCWEIVALDENVVAEFPDKSPAFLAALRRFQKVLHINQKKSSISPAR